MKKMLIAGMAFAFVAMTQADLIHRYDFNGDAEDSVGTAHGTAEGTASFTGTALDLYGEAGAYVNLPGGLIDGLESVTFEFWTEVFENANWCRIYDFGDTNVDGLGRYYVMFTPHSDAGDTRMSYADEDPGYDHELIATAPGVMDNQGKTHVACVYDPPSGVMSLYMDGVRVGQTALDFPLSSISNVYSYIGRSLYSGDAYLNATIDEFRIHDTALSPVEVAAGFVAGPEQPDHDTSVLGNLDEITVDLDTTMNPDDTQNADVLLQYAMMTEGVKILGDPGLTLESSDTNIVTIDANGLVTAISAGTATINASYDGKTGSAEVTVEGREGVVTAGTLYVDLSAADTSAGDITWVNRAAGMGDFYEVGDAVRVDDVADTGIPGVQFHGTNAYYGPATTEDLEGSSDRSFEVWAFNPEIAAEETLVALGHRETPYRNNSFNYGAHPTWGAAAHWDSDIGWNGAPVAGKWHYLVYTYDGTTARVYADGVLKNSADFSIDTFPAEVIRIAAQGNGAGDGFDFVQALTGYIGSVRIHGGTLSAADVQNNYTYGVEMTHPGELLGVNLNVTKETVKVTGAGQVTATADFENRDYLDVTLLSTWTSGDTNILTIDANGQYRGVSEGTATLTCDYNGQQSSVDVEVVAAPEPVMAHRYSFNEEGATVATDSVGEADGELLGGATITNGVLGLDGVDSYVNLPNGIMSSLTNATFEVWTTWNGPDGQWWQRIFDFGNNTEGEDGIGDGTEYMFLCPYPFLVSVVSSTGDTFIDLGTGAFPFQERTHVVITYNYDGKLMRLYMNGEEVGSVDANIRLFEIEDVNNWLGRSNYSADPYFNGSITEFRIYDGILSADTIMSNFAAGPDPVAVSPELSITEQDGNVVISWPVEGDGFVLEASNTLGAATTWQPVEADPVVEGDMNTVTLPASESMQFYRLTQ
ncbi:MAG: Ig-like domain-containing protein [Verrucomicrobia bacterium]|nr:Ig-like domain-containing protein [Verrucomicrobiota bacterium]MCF7707968.1 Ig-like domain-containing protein [Verrucomicrobiota bacterium]